MAGSIKVGGRCKQFGFAIKKDSSSFAAVAKSNRNLHMSAC